MVLRSISSKWLWILSRVQTTSINICVHQATFNFWVYVCFALIHVKKWHAYQHIIQMACYTLLSISSKSRVSQPNPIYVRFDDSIVLLSNSRVLQFSVCQDEEVSAVNDAAEIARDSLDRRYDDAQPNNNLSQISQNYICELWGHVFQCIVFVFLMIYCCLRNLSRGQASTY